MIIGPRFELAQPEIEWLDQPPGEDAAVDGRGRFYGLEGLWVVDASVMPTVPSSNIHLPTLMIAERMAEWL